MARKTPAQIDSLLEGYQARTDAETDFNEIAANLKRELRGDTVLDNATSGALRSEGFGAEKVESTNGADIIVTLYHAYDGREVRKPLYQVEHALKQRFPRNSDECPREYWNKQVWHIRSQGSEITGTYQCKLSPRGPEETQAEMRAAGLAPNCRKVVKGGGFQTEFEADEHFRRKHPRRWQAYQRYLDRASQRRTADMMAAMAQSVTSQNTRPAPEPTE